MTGFLITNARYAARLYFDPLKQVVAFIRDPVAYLLGPRSSGSFRHRAELAYSAAVAVVVSVGSIATIVYSFLFVRAFTSGGAASAETPQPAPGTSAVDIGFIIFALSIAIAPVITLAVRRRAMRHTLPLSDALTAVALGIVLSPTCFIMVSQLAGALFDSEFSLLPFVLTLSAVTVCTRLFAHLYRV